MHDESLSSPAGAPDARRAVATGDLMTHMVAMRLLRQAEAADPGRPVALYFRAAQEWAARDARPEASAVLRHLKAGCPRPRTAALPPDDILAIATLVDALLPMAPHISVVSGMAGGLVLHA